MMVRKFFLSVVLTLLLSACWRGSDVSIAVTSPIELGRWATVEVTIMPDETGEAILEVRGGDPDVDVEQTTFPLFLRAGEEATVTTRVRFNETGVARLHAILATPDGQREMSALRIVITPGGGTPYGPGTPIPGTVAPLEESSQRDLRPCVWPQESIASSFSLFSSIFL